MKHFLPFLLILLACAEAKNKTQVEYAVWAENIWGTLPVTKVVHLYPVLKSYGFEIFLAIKEEDLKNDTLDLNLLSKIEYRPWMLLSEEKGYWPSVENAEEFSLLIKTFLEKTKTKKGSYPTWIIFDLEPPLYKVKPMSKMKGLEFLSAITQIYTSPVSYIRGRATIKETVQFLHNEGIKVMCVTIPFIIDDMLDGDDDIQKKFGLPVENIEWDEVSFMVYRSGLSRIMNFEEDLVFSYSLDAKRFFGEKAGIDIGLVGPDSFGNPGSSKEEIEKDISAAVAGGIKKVHIWALDGMLENLNTWLSLQVGLTTTPKPQKNTKIFRELILKIFD